MKSAGYSGTTLPKKLGIKPDGRSLLVSVPRKIAQELAPSASVGLGFGVKRVSQHAQCPRSVQDLDFVLLFVRTEAELKKNFVPLMQKLQPAGMLWVGWPKKASGLPTDLSENVVRQFGFASGLVDVKICAIDETWSGLKFVYRLKDRPR